MELIKKKKIKMKINVFCANIYIHNESPIIRVTGKSSRYKQEEHHLRKSVGKVLLANIWYIRWKKLVSIRLYNMIRCSTRTLMKPYNACRYYRWAYTVNKTSVCTSSYSLIAIRGIRHTHLCIKYTGIRMILKWFSGVKP